MLLLVPPRHCTDEAQQSDSELNSIVHTKFWYVPIRETLVKRSWAGRVHLEPEYPRRHIKSNLFTAFGQYPFWQRNVPTCKVASQLVTAGACIGLRILHEALKMLDVCNISFSSGIPIPLDLVTFETHFAFIDSYIRYPSRSTLVYSCSEGISLGKYSLTVSQLRVIGSILVHIIYE